MALQRPHQWLNSYQILKCDARCCYFLWTNRIVMLFMMRLSLCIDCFPHMMSLLWLLYIFVLNNSTANLTTSTFDISILFFEWKFWKLRWIFLYDQKSTNDSFCVPKLKINDFAWLVVISALFPKFFNLEVVLIWLDYCWLRPLKQIAVVFLNTRQQQLFWLRSTVLWSLFSLINFFILLKQSPLSRPKELISIIAIL